MSDKDYWYQFREQSYSNMIAEGNHEQILCELLCVVHRDGGQYIQKHGLLKSLMDGIELICKERSK